MDLRAERLRKKLKMTPVPLNFEVGLRGGWEVGLRYVYVGNVEG